MSVYPWAPVPLLGVVPTTTDPLFIVKYQCTRKGKRETPRRLCLKQHRMYRIYLMFLVMERENCWQPPRRLGYPRFRNCDRPPFRQTNKTFLATVNEVPPWRRLETIPRVPGAKAADDFHCQPGVPVSIERTKDRTRELPKIALFNNMKSGRQVNQCVVRWIRRAFRLNTQCSAVGKLENYININILCFLCYNFTHCVDGAQCSRSF